MKQEINKWYIRAINIHKLHLIYDDETKKGYELIKNLEFIKIELRLYKKLKPNKIRKYTIQILEETMIKICKKYLLIKGVKYYDN